VSSHTVSVPATGRRIVTTVNAVIAVAVIVLVAAVALVVRPPAPPGIAEFAPQASKPITKAPPGQASRFGSGSGQCTAGAICVGAKARKPAQPTAVVAAPAGVPSALQCFTWPDGAVTQTFDPQSPPCIATWPGAAKGNGGATSPGVTGSTITVAYPASSTSSLAAMRPIIDFFNTHFELYGRQIVVRPFSSEQADDYSTSLQDMEPPAQQADAVHAESLHPFAATDFVDNAPTGFALPSYLDHLANHGVVSVSGGEAEPLVSSAGLNAHAPYEWTYLPDTESLLVNTASMICRGLAGRPAIHASAYSKTTRKFAVALPEPAQTNGPLPGVSAMLHTLAACGVQAPVIYYDTKNNNDGAEEQNFVKLKNDGVTSVIYYAIWGSPSDVNALPPYTANSVGYQPEWINTSHQSWISANFSPANEAASAFGVASWNKQLPLGSSPWYQAFTMAGGQRSAAGSLISGADFYEELLLLASGIQLAGPHLTPQSFSSGLNSTGFPNPGADAAPSYQAHVGFAANSHFMVNDFAAYWLNGTPVSALEADEETQAGDTYEAFCYVDLGARWSQQGWPTTDRFFSGSRCR
jgi:hypothetical protein